MSPVLTVVIAAKDPPQMLLSRCLASFAALPCASELHLLIVSSGELPPLDPTVVAAFGSLEVVRTPPKGVYAAYNAGIDASQGRYLLFFGVDDIALPPFAAAVSRLEAGDLDFFAAACYMEREGLRQPSKKPRALIAENWCQQGLFYSKAALGARRFDLRYPIQADHKLNIEVVTDPRTRWAIGDYPVAFFSSGGLSTRRHDVAFIRDFPQIIRTHYGAPLGTLYAIRQRLAAWVHGPIEQRYSNPES